MPRTSRRHMYYVSVSGYGDRQCGQSTRVSSTNSTTTAPAWQFRMSVHTDARSGRFVCLISPVGCFSSKKPQVHRGAIRHTDMAT
jgi:hypothetical protein